MNGNREGPLRWTYRSRGARKEEELDRGSELNLVNGSIFITNGRSHIEARDGEEPEYEEGDYRELADCKEKQYMEQAITAKMVMTMSIGMLTAD